MILCLRVLLHPTTLPRRAPAYAAIRSFQRRGYPVDNNGKKVELTMAYVGTRPLFERAGFTKAADTDSVSGGFLA